VIFESHGLTTTLRHATPPALFWASAHALTESIEPWNSPGANGEPTSAMTKMVMSVGVIPTSVACSGSLVHGSAAADVVVSPPATVVATALVVAALAAVATVAEPELLSSSLRLQAAAVTASRRAAANADERDRTRRSICSPLCTSAPPSTPRVGAP
jgi:hypothetical protein